jgi:cytochrome c
MKLDALSITFILLTFFSCSLKKSDPEAITQSEPKPKEFFIVPGEDEELDPELVKKGKVFISYSGCYECHKENDKAKGPAFADIARRYPVKEVYIDLLARKVISGGTGTWGYPVMSPHPKLTLEETRAMVIYILSLENQ